MTVYPRTQLGSLVKIIRGISYKSSELSEHGAGVPMVNLRNVGKGGGFRKDGLKYYTGEFKSTQVLDPGDLVLANTDLSKTKDVLGSPFLVPASVSGAVLSLDLSKLVPDESVIDKRFLNYFLQSPEAREFMKAHGQGITVMHLRMTALPGLAVPVPLLDEQRRLVEALDDHLSRLDKALAELDRSEVLAKNLLASAMSSAFSDAPAPRKAIGDFAEVKGGKRLPKGTPWSPTSTAHPYIRSTDIKAGLIDEENLVFVPDGVWDSISRYTVDEGDVLVTIAGTIGQTGVVTPKLHGANLTENAAKIVAPRDLVEPHFLEMYLRSPRVSQEMQFLARATTQPKLALYRIQEILVPLPPLGEQVAILDRLHKLQGAHRVSQTRVQELQRQISDLRRSLLHSAFEGKLLNGFNNE